MSMDVDQPRRNVKASDVDYLLAAPGGDLRAHELARHLLGQDRSPGIAVAGSGGVAVLTGKCN